MIKQYSSSSFPGEKIRNFLQHINYRFTLENLLQWKLLVSSTIKHYSMPGLCPVLVKRSTPVGWFRFHVFLAPGYPHRHFIMTHSMTGGGEPLIDLFLVKLCVVRCVGFKKSYACLSFFLVFTGISSEFLFNNIFCCVQTDFYLHIHT